MKAALITEYRKLVSTRMWWLLLAVMFAYMIFMGVVMAFTFTVEPSGQSTTSAPAPIGGVDAAESVYTLGAALGYVFPLIIGALAVTGEFRHQTITPTLLAEPRRSVVLSAKVLSAVAIGVVFGVVGTLGTIVGGAPLLGFAGDGAYLTDGGVLTAALLAAVALALWAIVGVGVGTLLPNQVAAIVVILAFTQFVGPLLRVALAAVDWLAGVAKFMPGAAGEALAGSSIFGASGMTDLLGRWEGGLVLVAYGIVFAVIGYWTTLRRDVT